MLQLGIRNIRDTMDIEECIPVEVEKLIEGGTLLKNLLQDCKEKRTISAIRNIKYSKGNCTFELFEDKKINCGYFDSIVPCAFFIIECVGVTQISQEVTGDIEYYDYAEIKFSVNKLSDKILVSFSYIHEYTQNKLFFVESEKMKLVKYKIQY